MSSLISRPNGHFWVQFIGSDRKHKTVRLGGVSKRVAQGIKVRIEEIAATTGAGHLLTARQAAWLSELSDQLADRIAATGLVPRRSSSTLGAFLDAYESSRTVDLKPATLKGLSGVSKSLVGFLGRSRSLRSVSEGDAEDYRRHLLAQGLAESTTVRRRCGIAKQFFAAALKYRLIETNPFGGLPTSLQAETERMRFISQGDTQKVLDACPSDQWRLIVALARFGGLRCPSEVLALRWGDVDWEQERIRVRSPKTERHVGKGSRMIPMFPELRTWLDVVWSQAEPAEYVISFKSKSPNLRQKLTRIIRRAGLEPWPKPFQNLRSTRETELAETYPIHVVCAWMGNSQAVAKKHYLQVTDEYFERATKAPLSGGEQKIEISGLTDWWRKGKFVEIWEPALMITELLPTFEPPHDPRAGSLDGRAAVLFYPLQPGAVREERPGARKPQQGNALRKEPHGGGDCVGLGGGETWFCGISGMAD